MPKSKLHAIDAQKKIINLLGDIDDTSPLGPKTGRILVLLNTLGSEISWNEEKQDDASIEEAREWLARSIRLLPDCVAHMGNFGASNEREFLERWNEVPGEMKAR